LNLLWPEPKRGRARPNALVATSDMGADRVEFLCQMFPECRIPYIVRNGIEVLASRMENKNFKDVPFEAHCHIWVRSYGMALWGANREEFVVVRHEALVDNPDKTVAEALSSCGLSYHADCVNAVAGTRFHPTAAAGESAEAGADLKQRHQRWEGWSEAQRTTFSTICGEAMDYFGYPMPWLTL
ncbi:MAG: sulfotransferase, partial [Kiritimatiellae bacterium]|nr:sulfotransferase [Kiritimatiellia bacterium]